MAASSLYTAETLEKIMHPDPVDAVGTLQSLVKMLHWAAYLEHCLLNTYLTAACSLKCTPEEFMFLEDGKTPNPRGPLQFEKARNWKAQILGVAREEMVHLHNVQCMLRALGERAEFHLPKQDDKGAWIFPEWMARDHHKHRDAPLRQPEDEQGGLGNYISVPIQSFSLEAIQRFVLYESSDALLNLADFQKQTAELFSQLKDFETILFKECALALCNDDAKREAMSTKIDQILQWPPKPDSNLPHPRSWALKVDDLHYPDYRFTFGSISDFYLKGVLPLYKQAFKLKLVKYNNLYAVNEFSSSAPAAEGFMPLIPVSRSFNFSDYQATPSYAKYESVDTIVRQIVDEGEGFPLFIQSAEKMLSQISNNPGHVVTPRNLVKSLLFPPAVNTLPLAAKAQIAEAAKVAATAAAAAAEAAMKVSESGDAAFVYNAAIIAREAATKAAAAAANLSASAAGVTEQELQALNNCLNLRNSHLYHFAMVMKDLHEEETLVNHRRLTVPRPTEPAAPSAGETLKKASKEEGETKGTFSFTRTQIKLSTPAVQALADSLPHQFNAAYLSMCVWLSRMYEVTNFSADEKKRMAIEMIATWPLMSMAVRPMLELAAFLCADYSRFFNIKQEGLPTSTIQAQQLLNMFDAPGPRTEKGNYLMDDLVVTVLDQVSQWAADAFLVISTLKGDADEISPVTKSIILARLKNIIRLKEFKEQYSFRIAGGYANTPPTNKIYVMHQQADPSQYEERPSKNMFRDSLLLRLRFGGHANVMLATDPDPPVDEVGVSGTVMFNAQDSKEDPRWFDRSLVWRADDHKALQRGPEGLPKLGVNLMQATVCVTSKFDKDVQHFFAGGEVNSIGGVVASAGAVQTSGIQAVGIVDGMQELCDVPLDLLAIEVASPASSSSSASAPAMPIDLSGLVKLSLLPAERPGVPNPIYPILSGDNHLMWRDGEPLDPFVLGLSVKDDWFCQREVFNVNNNTHEAVEFPGMTPVQRINSGRGPVGFDFKLDYVPQWLLNDPAFADIAKIKEVGNAIWYLQDRANLLITQILEQPLSDPDHFKIIVSYLYRLIFITTIPRGAGKALADSNTHGWLNVALNYIHTVSGDYKVSDTSVLDKLNKAISRVVSSTSGPGLQSIVLTPTAGGQVMDRKAANTRWLALYGLGCMDVDAVQVLNYAEVYIPLQVSMDGDHLNYTFTWVITFTDSMMPLIQSYALDFNTPFWNKQYTVDPNAKTRSVAYPYATDVVVKETLVRAEPSKYTYKVDNIPHTTNVLATLHLKQTDRPAGKETILAWSVEYTVVAPGTHAHMIGVMVWGQKMKSEVIKACSAQFGPGNLDANFK